MNPWMSQRKGKYKSLEQLVASFMELLRPPERMTIPQAAAKYRKLHNPGSYIGDYKNSEAPYMVQAQEEITNPNLKGVIFVGPAQSSKTESLILNTLAYGVKCDPMDTILYSPSKTSARDFSVRRVDRLHQHSPEIGAELKPTRSADNKFEKMYKSGMIFSLSWPTSSELAGKPIPRVLLTDYDRMDEDIDGEGEPFV